VENGDGNFAGTKTGRAASGSSFSNFEICDPHGWRTTVYWQGFYDAFPLPEVVGLAPLLSELRRSKRPQEIRAHAAWRTS